MSDIVIFGLITVGFGFLTWFLVNKGSIYSFTISLFTVAFCEMLLCLILKYFGVDNENIIPIIIIFSLITISLGFLTGFLYRKHKDLGFVMVLSPASFCLMNLLLVFVYFFYSNVEVSYQADYELVTYSVYIDGVKNETDKAVGVNLVDSKYSKYVDFDTGNIRSVQLKLSNETKSEVYDVCEYGISCKKDDIIVFSVLPGYDIISWDGIDPVKVTNRRAIFIQQDTKGEHNITINLKKL